MDGFGTGYHHNIPSLGKAVLIQTVYFPKTAAHPVTDHSMPQLFADGNAHPVGVGPIPPGVDHQAGIGLSGSAVKPLEDMVQFQRTGKFHRNSSKKAREMAGRKDRPDTGKMFSEFDHKKRERGEHPSPRTFSRFALSKLPAGT
jgi:hypothetical protein